MTERQKLDRALLRVECFKALDGWGTEETKDGNKTFRQLNLQERMREAGRLADWAIGDAP
jgi:hypothetical protein